MRPEHPNEISANSITRVWGDTVRVDVCKSSRCRQRVWWAMNVRTGRWMIFEGDPQSLSIVNEVDTDRPIWTVALALTHWGKCVDSDRFRRKTSAR